MSKHKMDPLPNEWVAKDGTVFNPNAPAEKHEEVPDRRPQVLYAHLNEDYAEAWLKQRNGNKALDNRGPIC